MRSILAVGIPAFVLGLAVTAWLPRDAVAPALAQSVLPDVEVDWRALGRVNGTQLVYLEFADGSRCLATDGGAGTVDCDWDD
ncbi:hypothetical protein [Sediminicurvatus halobius]|uniref:Uncharacterized protein n=1 Tax=Sediminicurvatus halobius TaxID=2182432 RepID=A0A2U2N8M8_9GAMM|nr:hypothetical protein [Spiribacter halobius]PWG65490.1 hypothetical protein DEM34_01750 [Spiribacter halobius]UEX76514.1 hypothetical protein LMH63_11125 [Spiribacter halobius]